MANILYNAGVRELFKDGSSWDAAGVWEAILERSTSTYTPNKDDDTVVDAANGFVEVSVASYAAVTITGAAITEVDASDSVKLDCDDAAFGNLETGQTVKAVIVRKVGTNIPLMYIDTDTTALLPRALGGGAFSVQIAGTGVISAAQV